MSFHIEINGLIARFEDVLSDLQTTLELKQAHIKNSSSYMDLYFKKSIDNELKKIDHIIPHYEYTLYLLMAIKQGDGISSGDSIYLEAMPEINNFLKKHQENILIIAPIRRHTL